MRDGRETAYWLVKNLHGARRNDFWINTDSKVNSDAQDRTVDAQDRAPISIETQTQQGLQNPSGGISGSSSVTPQRVTEEPGIESEAGDRHQRKRRNLQIARWIKNHKLMAREKTQTL